MALVLIRGFIRLPNQAIVTEPRADVHRGMATQKTAMSQDTILFHNELYYRWPDCRVVCAQNTSWGPIPQWGAQAFAGVGPFSGWKEEIGDPLINLLSRYPRAYRFGLLRLAGAYSTAVGKELFISTAKQMPIYMLHVLELYNRGDFEIADLCCWPEELIRRTSILPVSFFRHVPWSSVQHETLQMARRVWPSVFPRIKRAVMCAPFITYDTVLCLLLPVHVQTPALIQASSKSTCSEIYDSVRHVLSLTRGEWRWHQVSDPDTLIELQFRALEKLCPAFPQPPFEGIVGIEPLRTYHAASNEAREMGHCLMFFLHGIAEGAHYAYRMIFPERATILLQFIPPSGTVPGKWLLHSVAGIQNQPLQPETIDYARFWVLSQGGVAQ